MDIAIIDYSRKPRRYYMLNLTGNWVEVKREDFVTESIKAYLERSKE